MNHLNFFGISAISIMLLTTACAEKKVEAPSSLDEWEASYERADKVFSYGSTIGGGYFGIYLFPDDTWEYWVATCTDEGIGGRGTFKIQDETIILYNNAGSQFVLSIVERNGKTLVEPLEIGEQKEEDKMILSVTYEQEKP